MSAASLIARIRSHSAHVTVVGQVRRPLAGRRVDPDRPAALDTRRIAKPPTSAVVT